MIRVLHVVTSSEAMPRGGARAWGFDARMDAADARVVACRCAMMASPECEHAVLVLGGSEVERRVRGLGLEVWDRISMPLGRPGLAARSVGRYVRERGPFDVVQPWQGSAARGIGGGVAGVADVPCDELAAEVLGLAGELEATGGCGGELARVRERLGAWAGLPLVVFAADPMSTADAIAMFHMIGLSDKSGARFVCVMPRGCRGAERAIRLHRDVRLVTPLVCAEGSALEWMGEADVVIVPEVPGGSWRLVEVIAERRGVPTVRIAYDTGGPFHGPEAPAFASATKELVRAIAGAGAKRTRGGSADRAKIAGRLAEHWMMGGAAAQDLHRGGSFEGRRTARAGARSSLLDG